MENNSNYSSTEVEVKVLMSMFEENRKQYMEEVEKIREKYGPVLINLASKIINLVSI